MWVKLDDQYHENPKVLSVGLGARWIHVASMSWCGKHQTDGVIPRRRAFQLGSEDETCRPIEWIQELVNAGLFEKHGDDAYLVHDFLEYNPSVADVESGRYMMTEQRRSAGRARTRNATRDAQGRLVKGNRAIEEPDESSQTSSGASGAAGPAGASGASPVNPLTRSPVNPSPDIPKSVNASRAREGDLADDADVGGDPAGGNGADAVDADNDLRTDPRFLGLTNDQRIERGAFAAEIGEELDRMAGRRDPGIHRSAGFHRRVAFFLPQVLVREALNAARDAMEARRSGNGHLRGGPDGYFAGAVRKVCERDGFDIGVRWGGRSRDSPASTTARTASNGSDP